MDPINFTDIEKRAIALYRYQSKRSAVFLNAAAYAAPSIVFAVYAFIKQDFLALLVAYGALLILMLLWLTTASKDAVGIQGAFAKYEAFVAQHTKPPSS